MKLLSSRFSLMVHSPIRSRYLCTVFRSKINTPSSARYSFTSSNTFFRSSDLVGNFTHSPTSSLRYIFRDSWCKLQMGNRVHIHMACYFLLFHFSGHHPVFGIKKSAILITIPAMSRRFIFCPYSFAKEKTNERLLLCFMSHLSMIILSHRKTEKKIFMVSAWLVFGYGWSVFG